jgi:hypothetical protein
LTGQIEQNHNGKEDEDEEKEEEEEEDGFNIDREDIYDIE